MDKISELLQYVRRTNPEMTREKLIEELSKSDYVARSLIFTKENFHRAPKVSHFDTPLPCQSRRGVQSVYSWRCTSSSACRNCDDLRSFRRS